ncbi:amino acid permease [Brooklawnia sp.]|uniref:amino acid permease n=1 Tax=Brooklawnia sp. TaxID=2699740 RepID=UPI00311D79AE
MSSFDKIQAREQGLSKALTSRQISMIALGGAIGTGLFLGSKFAISYAGPSVIISYAIGAVVALLLMAALAEMTIQHPTSGSFGAYAEHYIGPMAGFLVRISYWSCIVLAVGTEVTAIGTYMKFWLPDVPGLVWIICFSAALIGVNMFNVHAFGTLEFWLSSIKVFAIIAFIIMAAVAVFGNFSPDFGFHNYTADGGFMPNGIWGTWIAVIVSIFSYLSIEMIAVAAGEAEDPETATKSAFRTVILRLFLFYICTLALIVAIAPMHEILEGGSPFVTVMSVLGIPFADSILNFVVIIAALSAMNSQLYTSTRMAFSLARGGDAPAFIGRVAKNGAPVNALVLSAIGIAIATIVYVINPEQAFVVMMAISMFGAMFTWMMIFVSHIFFRRSLAKQGIPVKYKLPFYPVGTYVGVFLMAAILLTTAFTDSSFNMTLVFGSPFLAVVSVWYWLRVRPRKLAESAAERAAESAAESTAEAAAERLSPSKTSTPRRRRKVAPEL